MFLTFYFVRSMVGKGNLLLRHLNFLPNSGDVAWRVADLNAVLYLPRNQNEEIKIINISFRRVEIEPTACRVYSHALYTCTTAGLIYLLIFKYSKAIFFV